MDKILIQVFVPALGTAFDIFIPKRAHMWDVLELVKKAISEMAEGRFLVNEETAICNRDDGTIININLSVEELGLHNGSRLMLI